MTADQPTPAPASAAAPRPRNGLGVAALVIGVASLVAAVSFILFPIALLGGLVGAILGVIALRGGASKGATNTGQAVDVFTRFDKCIAQAGNRSDVSNCITRFANDVRP